MSDLNQSELAEIKRHNELFNQIQQESIEFFIEAKQLERVRNVLRKRFVEQETDGIQYSEEEFNDYCVSNILWEILQKYHLKLKESKL